MQREQTPTWVGPATAALILLVLAGIGAVLWMTVFSGGEEHEEPAAPAAYQVVRVADQLL